MRLAKAVLAILLLAACSDTLTQDDARRIDQLYAHTRIMLEITSPEDAAALGMRPEALVATDDPLLRLQAVEQTMNLESAQTLKDRIIVAEERMNDLMILWQETPSGRGEYTP